MRSGGRSWRSASKNAACSGNEPGHDKSCFCWTGEDPIGGECVEQARVGAGLRCAERGQAVEVGWSATRCCICAPGHLSCNRELALTGFCDCSIATPPAQEVKTILSQGVPANGCDYDKRTGACELSKSCTALRGMYWCLWTCPHGRRIVPLLTSPHACTALWLQSRAERILRQIMHADGGCGGEQG